MSRPLRDLVGYGASPPHPRWPGGARLALNIVMNYEEGSEYDFHTDGESEKVLSEVPGGYTGLKRRDLAIESIYEYGSRVGFWRLMRLFSKYGVPITVTGCAQALELNPAAARAIVEAGHDICCHGWRWVYHSELGEAEERDHIARAVESLRTLTGVRPEGWYCRYAPSENTRRLVVEEGGFLYDSDAYNDDLPYWVEVGDKPHLVIPYNLDLNDGKFATAPGYGSGEDFLTTLIESFDALYEEGAEAPKMMTVGLHMRIVGRAGRTFALRRFLDHVLKHDKVWLCRRIDIAKHWHAHHRPTPAAPR
jgi:putative urate catabolism protein